MSISVVQKTNGLKIADARASAPVDPWHRRMRHAPPQDKCRGHSAHVTECPRPCGAHRARLPRACQGHTHGRQRITTRKAVSAWMKVAGAPVAPAVPSVAGMLAELSGVIAGAWWGPRSERPTRGIIFKLS